jgi:hypothetical protein
MEHLPSLRALRASDDRMLAEELRLGATRQQVAVIRALADEFERCLLRSGAVQTLREQLVHELARLGCRSLETATAMAKTPVNAEDQSGLHCVPAVAGT